MGANLESTWLEFAKLALRVSSPAVCSAFLLMTLLPESGWAATSEPQQRLNPRSIADRVSAVRDAIARNPGRRYEVRQDLAQWFNWRNGWNNWRNW